MAKSKHQADEIDRLIKEEQERSLSEKETRERQQTFQKAFQQVNDRNKQTEAMLTQTSREISSVENALLGFPATSAFMERAKIDLGWLVLIANLALLPVNFYKIIHGLFLSKENKAARGMQVVWGVAGLGLSILAAIVVAGIVYVAAPIIVVASVAKGMAENIWNLGVSIYNRIMLGRKKVDEKNTLSEKISALEVELKAQIKAKQEPDDKKLEELRALINQRRAHNKDVALKAHSTVQNTVALVGAILLFTPFALAGFVILTATAGYGLLDAAKLNPFIRLMEGINYISKKVRGKPVFDPFSEKSKKDLVDDLTESANKEIAKENKKAAKAQPQPKPKLESEAQIFKQMAEQNHVNAADLAKQAVPAVPEKDNKAENKKGNFWLDNTYARRFANNSRFAVSVKKSKEEESEGEGERPHHNHHQ